MWGKSAELERLIRLRVAVVDALSDLTIPSDSAVRVLLTVWAERHQGDLDNFVTGICDGLQAADARAAVDEEAWANVHPQARPHSVVALNDDRMVDGIVAERVVPDERGVRYELTLEW